MKRYLLLALLVLAFAGQVYSEEGRPGGMALGTATITATVEAIDYQTRNVTLKTEEGKTFSLKVGEAAHNFDQVKKGDKVTFKYMEAFAVDVRKADGEPMAESEIALERAPKGARPQGVVSETVTIKALVQDINYDTRQVTLKGPQGDTITLKVGEQAKRFNEVKKGDQVVVQYTEALGISVSKG